ncbi:hypothetical protein D9V41_09200 [Aeromicrobium phragmitis]|uniref:Scaffolding protein n=1 Tax=Aeromicrobium phragmitis TaxID=2478914 RepID=A0A3L8PLF6_9ACTN|nr:hypothetical protein [Aeromicrobium phragmitis]RLV56054.1 hypothetical protein D9V41_09200 [Aeromicrobium phragmitis]
MTEAAPETQTTTTDGTSGEATTTATTTPPEGGQSPQGKDNGSDDLVEAIRSNPEKAKAEIERLRQENASARTNAKEQAAEEARKGVLEDIAKALGFKDGEKAPTVDELKQQLTEQTTKTEQASAAYRDTQAELVVWRNATDLGVDAAALTDSRAFERAIADLDPASDSFAEDVKKAAQEAAEQNPKLKAAPAAGKSGAELNGGTGEGAITQEQFDRMSGQERNELYRTNPELYRRLSGR